MCSDFHSLQIANLDTHTCPDFQVCIDLRTHLRKFGQIYVCLDLRFKENENVDTLEKIYTGMCV